MDAFFHKTIFADSNIDAKHQHNVFGRAWYNLIDENSETEIASQREDAILS